jgi:hypothetical protein
LFHLGAQIAVIGAVLAYEAHYRLRADQLPPPEGPVILTVAGAITRTNGAGTAEFDRALLERLGLVRLRSWTPWSEGEVEFEGVPARRLMEAVGAIGTTLVASALNDYQSVIPLTDFERYPVLLATRIDGQPLTIRNKGPIWIVYPWSAHPELDDLPTRRKSVWQLRSLRVQ